MCIWVKIGVHLSVRKDILDRTWMFDIHSWWYLSKNRSMVYAVSQNSVVGRFVNWDHLQATQIHAIYTTWSKGSKHNLLPVCTRWISQAMCWIITPLNWTTVVLPSGDLTYKLLKMVIDSECSHWKWWLSIAMLNCRKILHRGINQILWASAFSFFFRECRAMPCLSFPRLNGRLLPKREKAVHHAWQWAGKWLLLPPSLAQESDFTVGESEPRGGVDIGNPRKTHNKWRSYDWENSLPINHMMFF